MLFLFTTICGSGSGRAGAGAGNISGVVGAAGVGGALRLDDDALPVGTETERGDVVRVVVPF